MKKHKIGILYKGKFCELWGGLYTDTSKDFTRGTLKDISRTIKAEMHDAGVVVLYED